MCQAAVIPLIPFPSYKVHVQCFRPNSVGKVCHDQETRYQIVSPPIINLGYRSLMFDLMRCRILKLRQIHLLEVVVVGGTCQAS